ncbi:MAG TPA: PH domain-containing protein [Actinomycetota bacterium]|nr:PH domain-containing protein [Actinomycetota bacterium]
MQEQPASEPPVETEPVEGRKLHPAAVPIWFLYDIGRGILGIIPLLVAGGSRMRLVIALMVGSLMLIAPLIRYSRFRYDIKGNTLVVEGGLLSRWRRVVPRERVQSVNVVQKLRHRAFGVVELRIEAVGGKETEAALVAVEPAEADRIRGWASGGELEPAEATADEPPPLARLTGKDLLVAGLTGGRVAVLAALIGYAEQFVGEDSFDAFNALADRILPGASLVVVISVLATSVLALSLLLSVALTILVYWDFTVRRQEDRLVITRGLLERRRAQVPLRRVQAISVDENLLRRPFGLASLSLVVAGYTKEGQDSEESSVLLPIARRDKAWQVATEVLGAPPDLAGIRLVRPPARALVLRMIGPAVVGLVAGTTGWLLAGDAGALGFVILPLGWIAAYLSWRFSGSSVVPGYVLIRTGWLVRKTSLVPEPNIQHLRLTRSIFQKAFRVSTVRVNIPGTVRAAADMDGEIAEKWFWDLAGSRSA